MALVAKLPRRNMYLQENQYGSSLHLRINPVTQCCDGTYEPMIQNDPAAEGDTEAARGLPTPPSPGHAVLFGRVKTDPASNNMVLHGEWRHVEGPLQGGSFEMKLDDGGAASGWWSAAGEESSFPWQWMPSDADQELEVQPLKSDNGQQLMPSSSFGGSREQPRLRPTLSRRVDRGKTFFDEMLEAEGSSSVMIARWGVFCAWVFFYQTVGALGMSAFQFSGDVSLVLQCIFQAVYTSTYTSFLLVYSGMQVMPPLDYVTGVALYTLGYACFLALYAIALAPMDEDDVSSALTALYVVGSILFLAGSAVLVRATIPPPVPMLFRKASISEELCSRYSLCDQQSSLLWGSIAFLLGSVLFTVDASWSALNTESKPELLAPFCINMGYAFFTVGRVYFLWGSTTAECDALFRNGNGWGCKWCLSIFSGRSSSPIRKSKVEPGTYIEDGWKQREVADMDGMNNFSDMGTAEPMDSQVIGKVH